MVQLMTAVALKGCEAAENQSAVIASWTVTVFVTFGGAVSIYRLWRHHSARDRVDSSKSSSMNFACERTALSNMIDMDRLAAFETGRLLDASETEPEK